MVLAGLIGAVFALMAFGCEYLLKKGGLEDADDGGNDYHLQGTSMVIAGFITVIELAVLYLTSIYISALMTRTVGLRLVRWGGVSDSARLIRVLDRPPSSHRTHSSPNTLGPPQPRARVCGC